MDTNIFYTRKLGESWDEFSSKHNINLSEADLSYANLSEANLSDANLSEADLSEANLSDANLSFANLSEADLSEADLSYAGLWNANLSGADLWNANLSGADLWNANLSGADLGCADLIKASLSGADLSGANLKGTKGLGTKDGEIAFAQQLYKDIKAGKRSLKMSTWHTCKTTHCIAGWAFPDLEYPSSPASRLYPTLARYFFASNKEALAALRRVGNGEESVFA